MTPGNVTTRALGVADIPLVMDLTAAEGWSFEESDVVRLLRMGGGLVAEAGGEPVGLLTLVTHENLAWIGNVAVRPEARGRGVGGALVAAALAQAQARGVETVGLYSVLPAVTLYARAGFKDRGEAWSLLGRGAGGLPLPSGVTVLPASRLPELARFDARHFGADRSRMLGLLHEAFPEGFLVDERGGRIRGYAVAKPSATRGEIGPVVVEPGNLLALTTILDAALARLPAGEAEIAVPSANAPALRHLETRGFTRTFPTRIMYWGAPGNEANEHAVAGAAGLEKG